MKTTFVALTLGAALALSLATSGCGSSSCSADNCAGCCDASNTCQSATPAHCGQNGAACTACSGVQQCVLGTCQFNGNGGNNGGNGNGGGGEGVI